MIHTAKAPNLNFLFNHGLTESTQLPLMFDSAGNFCWELNSYLTKFGGGANSYGARPACKTVFSHAETLNVFQLYLERKGISLFEVDDEILYDFVKYKQDAELANSTTIKRTVRRILSLLEHTQSEHQSRKLLTTEQSKNGYQINASENHYRQGRRTWIRFLSHPCIDDLRDTPTEAVSFIRNTEITAWHEAISEYTSNQYIIDRWYVLSTLLEYTGSRIDEVINIPASAIVKAYLENDVVKSIPVLKGKCKGSFREILIPRSELQEIYKFIISTREQHPLCKIHDKIFVSERKGRPLSRSSFNSYYKSLINSSKHAEFLKDISYHNFRHRYFTILVAKNISELGKISKANILSVAFAITRKDSYHASDKTLSTYIHLTHDPEIQSILNAKTTDTETLAAIKEIMSSKDIPSELKIASINKLIESS